MRQSLSHSSCTLRKSLCLMGTSTFPSLGRGRSSWSSVRPWRFRSCSLCWVVDVPILQSCRFQFCSCNSSWSSPTLSLRSIYPMVHTVRQTIDIPQLLTRWSTSLFPGRAGSLPRGDAEASPWSKLFVCPWTFHSCSTRCPLSLLCGHAGSLFVVAQRPFLMVRPVWQTIEISQLQYAPGGQCSCCASRASLVKLAQVVLVGPCTQVHGQG